MRAQSDMQLVGSPITDDFGNRILLPAVQLAGADGSAGGQVTLGPSAVNTVSASRNQTAVAANSLILKAAAGNLYGLECCGGGVNGYVMAFDATSAPADGAVAPIRVYVISGTGSISRSYNPPIRFNTGITLVFSSTGPFTKTASATAFLAGDYV